MKFCDERIQRHLLNGGKIKKADSGIGWDYRPIKLDGELLVFADNGDDYIITKDDLINDWEIIGPEYDWDKIIEDKVLCVFNYINDPNDLYGLYPILGYLKEYKLDEDYKFTGVMIDSCKADFKQCKPFNPSDYNIIKDLKEYEE